MSMVLTIVHVLSCIFLVLVILLQTGKGAEMGAVFGGSSETVFGSSGAGNFLTRLTTAVAILFMLTSLTLTYLGGRQTTATIFDTVPAEAPLGGQAQLPVAPAAPPVQAPAPAPARQEKAAPPPMADTSAETQPAAPANKAPASGDAPAATQ